MTANAADAVWQKLDKDLKAGISPASEDAVRWLER